MKPVQKNSPTGTRSDSWCDKAARMRSIFCWAIDMRKHLPVNKADRARQLISFSNPEWYFCISSWIIIALEEFV
jgi:hypothetical protein